MSKPTPGPWRIDQHPDPDCAVTYVCAGKHLEVCALYNDFKTNAADARLIAAAPELLWFAKQILESGDMVTFPKDLECTWQITEAVTKHYNFG